MTKFIGPGLTILALILLFILVMSLSLVGYQGKYQLLLGVGLLASIAGMLLHDPSGTRTVLPGFGAVLVLVCVILLIAGLLA